MEQAGIASYDTRLYHRYLQVAKKETGHGPERDKRARHHTAIDTYECIAVVELHNEIGGECEECKLNPPTLMKQASRHPHQYPVKGGDGQGHLALRDSVLQSFDHPTLCLSLEISTNVSSEILVGEFYLTCSFEGFLQRFSLVFAV